MPQSPEGGGRRCPLRPVANSERGGYAAMVRSSTVGGESREALPHDPTVRLAQEPARRQVAQREVRLRADADLAAGDRDRQALLPLEVAVRDRLVHREFELRLPVRLAAEGPVDAAAGVLARGEVEDEPAVGEPPSHPDPGCLDLRPDALVGVRRLERQLDGAAEARSAPGGRLPLPARPDRNRALHPGRESMPPQCVGGLPASEERGTALCEVLVELPLNRLAHLFGEVEDDAAVLGGLRAVSAELDRVAELDPPARRQRQESVARATERSA